MTPTRQATKKITRLSGPCVEITPTPAQFDQFRHDLDTLRKSGAASNTAAILKAVHDAAAAGKIGPQSKIGRAAR